MKPGIQSIHAATHSCFSGTTAQSMSITTTTTLGATERAPIFPYPPRILLAKVGLDGHDRGIKVVARGLRDAGCHVIYGGIWQSPESVAIAVRDEDADWLGLSLLNGAHMTLVPRVLRALEQITNGRTRCMVGGIIPASDVAALMDMGVAGVFGPGTSIDSITRFLKSTRDSAGENVAALVNQARGGDIGAVSRLLTSISRGRVSQNDLVAVGTSKKTRAIALTGNAGVGKSSLIAAMLTQFGGQRHRVAVLACDPQSPLSGGALLGDRVRMARDTSDDQCAFIRSLAVPSGRQGIAQHLDLMISALELAGFDLVLVESVGVGQGDVAVRHFVDKVIVLVQPESGDSIQWEKAGLLEVADLVVVHKSDLDGAERLDSQLRQCLNPPGCRDVPIIRVSATAGTGLRELCEYVMS